jgi:very-short-patch-repair endonuclease
MRKDLMEEVAAVAEERDGVVTWAQLLAIGVRSSTVTDWCRSGYLVRLRPGVYLWRSALTDRSHLGALLAQQPRAVASHRAAAELHRFDGVDVSVAEVTVPPNVRLRGPLVHRTTDLVVPEIVLVDGLRTTDEVRTLCDLGKVSDDLVVERAVESYLRRRPEGLPPLLDRASALARPGRAGPRTVLEVLARRPSGAPPTDSDLETVFLQNLRMHGVEEPVRRFVLRDRGGRPICEFDDCYPDVRLFIELDGWAFHGSKEAFGHDRRRQNAAVALGWTPLRFTDSDVRRFGRRTAHLVDSTLHRLRHLSRGA